MSEEHEHSDSRRDDAPRDDDRTAPRPGTDVEAENTQGAGDAGHRKLREERDHLEEQLRRTMADMANMRRRAGKESEDARRRIVEGFTQELLPVLDNFELALSAFEEQGSQDPQAVALFEGVRMVQTLLNAALERHGVQPIEALDRPFDPDRHEALAVEARDGVDPGRVLRVLQAGYLLGDRVLRHAKVVVSGPPDGGKGPAA